MSGIFLILWDEDLRDKSPVLRPTKGGWPHLTLAYTGKELAAPELCGIAKLCFPYWAMKGVTLREAYVTSFVEDKTGLPQHRVLISVSAEDVESVETTRETYIRPYGNSDKFAMRPPHVSHSIHATLPEAESVVHMLNEDYLPYRVHVSGVAID